MNKELDYTRLNALFDKVNEFINTLHEELYNNNGFEMLIIAHDVMNSTTGTCTVLNKDDERESLIQCIDKAISGAALRGADANPQEWNILNGMAEYMMRLCAMFPELYENFQNGVEKLKKDNDKK